MARALEGSRHSPCAIGGFVIIAIDRLKQDHDALREQIDALEAALEHGGRVHYALQAICASCSAQLRDHVQRERRLAVTCSQQLGTYGVVELARFAIEHDTDISYLRVIKRCLGHEARFSLEAIRPAVLALMSGLRRHMEQQERALFPLLEQVAIASAVASQHHVAEAILAYRHPHHRVFGKQMWPGFLLQ